jgi:uncharacterized OB-fold protein
VTTTTRVPVAEGLFTWPDDQPRLIAGRDPSSGALSFPAGDPGTGQERVLLSRVGTLFTFTTQEFVPPSPPYAGVTDPATFVPYAVGYVELPEGLLVEGRLTQPDPEKLRIGQEMELVVVPFRIEPGRDGEPDREVVTFAFAPVPATSAGSAS